MKRSSLLERAFAIPATIGSLARQFDMTHATPIEPPLLSIATYQNRSLSKRGRRLWLVLIAATVFIVASGAALAGAWIILPFAGFEVFLVWLAFHILARHDLDYESLVVTKSDFKWELRNGLETELLEGVRDWARFCRGNNKFGSSKIQLMYGKNTVVVGRLMSASQRGALEGQMALVFRCVTH